MDGALRGGTPKSETVPCPLCGETAVDVLFSGDGYAMGTCRGCRLLRQSPRLTAAWLRGDHYDGDTQTQEHGIKPSRRSEGLESWQTKPQGAYEESVRILERFRPKHGGKGVWLDVGASTGGYLLAARESGWRAAGVELGARQVEVCRQRHGLDVFHGTLHEAGFPAAFAEVVSYRQVLEHIHDLHGELAEARRVLRPDGLLFVEVPHYGGLKYRIEAARVRLGLMRASDALRYVPAHLYYFKHDQLLGLLRRAGFEPLFVRTYGRWRSRRGPIRRAYDAVRDALRLGNKIRVIARKR